jgi:predicted RNA binding protein YcfA (HicA-like mRNA interferase family)
MPIKPKEALRRLLQKGCIQIKNNHGRHQKIKNPANNKTTVLPIHLGKDIDDVLWKKILKALDLEE